MLTTNNIVYCLHNHTIILLITFNSCVIHMVITHDKNNVHILTHSFKINIKLLILNYIYI